MSTIKQINKILSVFKESKGEIRPHFFVTGPTGSGKTFTISNLADQLGIPLLSINMAQITNEGIAGNSLSKALAPLREAHGKNAIVFFDEFDKAISTEASVTSGTVQQELLKILEADTTDVYGDYGKYVKVQTSNILFVFAGSFNGADINSLSDLLDHNVKPELLGRIGLHFFIEPTPLKELLNLLKNSALIDKYCSVMEGADKKKAIKAISEEIVNQYENNVIGIRIINSLIHQYFITGSFVEITKRTKHDSDGKPFTDLTFSG